MGTGREIARLVIELGTLECQQLLSVPLCSTTYWRGQSTGPKTCQLLPLVPGGSCTLSTVQSILPQEPGAEVDFASLQAPPLGCTRS